MADFGIAISKLRKGFAVTRPGWNGKGMFLFLVKEDDYVVKNVNIPSEVQGMCPWIAMFTADKKVVPWLASQTDMLATDWELKE